jgi:hypothetical protein
MRQFETGATRSPDAGRYDPEGFLSPIVIERFAEYMQKHRFQADGKVRDSDNWQKGMPFATYIKGAWRHFLHLWTRHRGYKVMDPGAAANMEEDLCALLFNINGMLFEILKNSRLDPQLRPDAVVSVGAPVEMVGTNIMRQVPSFEHKPAHGGCSDPVVPATDMVAHLPGEGLRVVTTETPARNYIGAYERFCNEEN